MNIPKKNRPVIKIAPSLMCADLSRLGEEVKALEEAGAGLFHFDVMDGHFVPNITMGADIMKAVRKKTSLPFEVHLMVSQPEKFIKQFAEAGSDIITVHIETLSSPYQTFREIKKRAVKVGVAVNPGTPVCRLESLIQEIDMVLVMSVKPGFAGGKFVPSSVSKIRAVRKMIDKQNLNAEIAVDGGVSKNTIPLLTEAGANILVGGSSSIFQPGKNYASAIREMKKAAK
jgi:ribulose-phosphate 3-epimerase